jgi:hypothetical protein
MLLLRYNHLKNAKCLFGINGVLLGTTGASCCCAAPQDAAAAAAFAAFARRSSLSFRSHSSTTCSSFLPGPICGRIERGPPATTTR